MRKTRKDFEEMAKKNSELEEAYDVLDKLSADEKKRLEYETRQRAIRDYNIGMLTAERRGIEAGRKIGRQEGREEGRVDFVTQLLRDGKYNATEISQIFGVPMEQIMRIRKEKNL